MKKSKITALIVISILSLSSIVNAQTDILSSIIDSLKGFFSITGYAVASEDTTTTTIPDECQTDQDCMDKYEACGILCVPMGDGHKECKWTGLILCKPEAFLGYPDCRCNCQSDDDCIEDLVCMPDGNCYSTTTTTTTPSTTITSTTTTTTTTTIPNLPPPCDSYGDVNNDGTINMGDVTATERCILGMPDCTTEQRRRADVNNDEEVNMGDVTQVERYILGVDDTFPVCDVTTTTTTTITTTTITSTTTTTIPNLPPPCDSYGDVNNDGTINMGDVTATERCILGMPDCTTEQRRRADVNNDGEVNMADVTKVERYILEIDDTFPVCETTTTTTTTTTTSTTTTTIVPENEKDMSKYTDKMTFLVSDKKWQDVLSLVPITTWTDSDGPIHKYPTLIYHEENFTDKTLELDKTEFIKNTGLYVSWNFKNSILAEEAVDSDEFTILFDLSDDMYEKMKKGIPRGDLNLTVSKIDPQGSGEIQYDILFNEVKLDKDILCEGDGENYWIRAAFSYKEKNLLKKGTNNLTLRRTGGNILIEGYVLFVPYFASGVINDECISNPDDNNIYDLCIRDAQLNKNTLSPGELISYLLTVENICNETIDLSGEETVFQGAWNNPSSLGELYKVPYGLVLSHVNTSIPEVKLYPNQSTQFEITLVCDKSENLPEHSFDADSIIYFMQQYSPDKLIIGETSQELDNLLIAAPELGAGLNQDKIQRISVNDYLSYWKSFKDVVYVEDNYGLALMASTYASLINVPLIVKGTSLDSDNVFQNRNVICVGSVNRICDEQYTLEQLQQKYTDETNTDKIILVNPNDLNIKVIEQFTPEKSNTAVVELYSKNSLASPVLAGAKHELIISTASTDYQGVDSFIENKIANLQLTPEYLTIVASPNAIEMSYLWTSPHNPSYHSYYSADAWQYSKFDDDPFLDLAVGRIFGLTVSDSSSNVARSLFYEETLKNEDRVLITRGYPTLTVAADVYAIGKVLNTVGYHTTVTPAGTTVEDWKNKFFISYNDHGSYSWAGIPSAQIPYLDNSFVATLACLTCDFREADSKKSLFCTNIIRKGGIGFIGATDTSGYFHRAEFLSEIFAQESTIGKAFINSKNSVMVYYGKRDNPMPWYTLLGDPTLKLKTIYTMPKPQLNFVGDDQYGKKYKLIIPAMRIEIPEDVKDVCQYPESVKPLYFTTAHNRQLDNNYQFEARFSLDGFEPVKGWVGEPCENGLINGECNESWILCKNGTLHNCLDIHDWVSECNVACFIGDNPFKLSLSYETTNEGKYLWIGSPTSRYFTTANDYEFTNYEFDIHLSEGETK